MKTPRRGVPGLEKESSPVLSLRLDLGGHRLRSRSKAGQVEEMTFAQSSEAILFAKREVSSVILAPTAGDSGTLFLDERGVMNRSIVDSTGLNLSYLLSS